MNSLSKMLASTFGFVFVVGTILVLLRFVGPDLRFCRTQGYGSSMRTVCLGVVEFKGDDIMSIFTIKPYRKSQR